MYFPNATWFRNYLVVPVFCDPEGPTLAVPSFFFPAGTHVVVWNLITLKLQSDSTNLARFTEQDGISISTTLPSYLQIIAGPWRLSDDQWAVALENQRTGSDEIAEVPYLVNYIYRGVQHSQDPVIVVAQDPVGTIDPGPGRSPRVTSPSAR